MGNSQIKNPRRVYSQQGGGGGTIDGSGTSNQITYWVDSNTVGALTTATYPSLTELSYIKGLTSAIQTQLNARRVYIHLGSTAANVFSPADSTTYYWGAISAAGVSTTVNLGRAAIIPNNITIKEISISTWVNSTIGSNETGTYSIVEVNGTTLSVVATTSIDTTMTWDSATRQNTKVISGLNISITSGNYILIKYDSPAWVTNPTNTWSNFIITAFL